MRSNKLSPYERLEAERVARKLRKTDWAVRVLGLKDLQTYHNWRQREVPITAVPDIAKRLRWSLDYLWLGKGASSVRTLEDWEEDVLDDFRVMDEQEAQRICLMIRAEADKARRILAKSDSDAQALDLPRLPDFSRGRAKAGA